MVWFYPPRGAWGQVILYCLVRDESPYTLCRCASFHIYVWFILYMVIHWNTPCSRYYQVYGKLAVCWSNVSPLWALPTFVYPVAVTYLNYERDAITKNNTRLLHLSNTNTLHKNNLGTEECSWLFTIVLNVRNNSTQGQWLCSVTVDFSELATIQIEPYNSITSVLAVVTARQYTGNWIVAFSSTVASSL